MLQKLIRSLYASQISEKLITSIDLVVVDNDIEKSALKMASELKSECPSRFTLNYYSYTEKGLSNVRNEILRIAHELSPEYIAFIDDDIFASEHWLENLIKTILNSGADMALGPTYPVFEETASKYVKGWFLYGKFENGEQLNELYGTGNLLMKTQFIREHNLLFDKRFNLSGGEDTYFGVQALEKGVKMIWSSNSVAYETIPPKKANLNWLIKRKYRSAGTYTYILKLRKKYLMLLKKAFLSIFYIVAGILTLPLTLIPFKNRYWSILKIAESLGALSGMANILYKEYS